MKSTIDYSALSGSEKSTKAVNDCKEYLSTKQYIALSDALRMGATKRDFEIGCGFLGIQGYPVDALYEYMNAEIAAVDEWEERSESQNR